MLKLPENLKQKLKGPWGYVATAVTAAVATYGALGAPVPKWLAVAAVVFGQ